MERLLASQVGPETKWERERREEIEIAQYPRPTLIEGEHIEDLPDSIKRKVHDRQELTLEDCDIPIPEVRQDGWKEGGWRNIEIAESGERMVSLASTQSPLFRNWPFPKFGLFPAYMHQYFPAIQGFHPQGRHIFGASMDLFAREAVARNLLAVSSYLPKGLNLTVLDAFRPQIVQQQLYQIMVGRLMAIGTPESQARIEAQKFVSIPRSNPPSPHLTGGTVDVAIFSHLTGMMMEYGTRFDSMDPESELDYFEKHEDSSGGEFQKNRRFLYWLMRIGDFHGWPFEWWHFDHAKTPVGAHITGKPQASYGSAERVGRIWGEYAEVNEE